MSWWDELLSILPAAGAAAAGASAGRAAGRGAEANANNNADALKIQAARALEDALQGRANLDLRQRGFALAAPNARASTAARGDALAGVQDAGISGPIVHTRGQVPQITGGLRPSLLSADTRALGQNMSRNAYLQQMQGDTFEPLPAPQIPSITPPPQAGALDSLLNGVTTAGVLSRLASPLLQKAIPSLFGGSSTDANTFVGPIQPTDANTFVGPTQNGSGIGFGGAPGGSAGWHFDPLMDRGNPNAYAINPLIGGAFGGFDQFYDGSGRPKVQAF